VWPAAVLPGLPNWLVYVIGTVTVILVAMAVCAILAMTIERFAYKPLRDAPRISVLITAIGVSFFLEYYGALPFVFGPNFYNYPRAFDVAIYQVAGIRFTNIMLIIIASSVFLMLLLNFIVLRTKIGKAMRAASFDKPTARLMGINVDIVISTTFAIGAAFAGAAGVLYATAFPRVDWPMGIYPGLKAFVAAVLGGIGSIPGAFVGALIMGQAETLAAGYVSTPMRDAIAFSLLILVLLIRPTGIFGEPEKEKA
jgi:branched-chain amino acid transport system permease protein